MTHSRVWVEQTPGSDGLVSVLGSTSYVIVRESLPRSEFPHIESVGDHCVFLTGLWWGLNEAIQSRAQLPGPQRLALIIISSQTNEQKHDISLRSQERHPHLVLQRARLGHYLPREHRPFRRVQCPHLSSWPQSTSWLTQDLIAKEPDRSVCPTEQVVICAQSVSGAKF